MIISSKTPLREDKMLFLSAIKTVDITQEIPPVYLAAFAIVMILVLFIANKLLTRMFIPRNSDDDAPVWSYFSKKNKRK